MTNYWPSPDDSPATKAEKEDAFRNDVRRTSTLFDQAKIGAALEEGRQAGNLYTGEEEGCGYPRQPSESPWSGGGAQVPPEEPLGYSVEDVPICAEPHEVERAADILRQREAPSIPERVDGADGAPTGQAVSSLSVGVSPTIVHRRRI
jgi:hypothetical protein